MNDVLGERYYVALDETLDALIPEDRDSLHRLAGDPRVWDFDHEGAPETVARAAYMAVHELLARHVVGEPSVSRELVTREQGQAREG